MYINVNSVLAIKLLREPVHTIETGTMTNQDFEVKGTKKSFIRLTTIRLVTEYHY